MAPIAKIEHFRVPPRWLFVKITDSTGATGWGEATLEGHTCAVEGALTQWTPQLLGQDADAIEHIWQTLYRGGFYRGGPVLMSALSGIDIALWDLKARRRGLPIADLLGGFVRHRIKVYAWIGGDSPHEVSTAARARKEQGFSAVKMNATGSVGFLDSPSVLDGAVERVRSVKALGLDVGVDFHGRLRRPMAKQLLRRLEGEGVLFAEEVLLPEQPEEIATLARASGVPMALGERLHSRWQVRPFLERGAVDILQVDVAHCGGLSEARRIAAMAEAYDVALAPHCPLGPIALAACLQLGACAPNHVIQEMSLGIHYNVEQGDADLDTYVVDKSVFKVEEGGYVRALRGPGLGVEIDEDAVRRASEGAVPWTSGMFFDPDGSIREW